MSIKSRRKKYYDAWTSLTFHGIKLPNPLHDREKPGDAVVVRRHIQEDEDAESQLRDEAARITPTNDVLLKMADRHAALQDWYDEAD